MFPQGTTVRVTAGPGLVLGQVVAVMESATPGNGKLFRYTVGELDGNGCIGTFEQAALEVAAAPGAGAFEGNGNGGKVGTSPYYR